MQTAYEKIRKDRLDQLSEPGKSIVASQFAATPAFESEYYEYISEHPPYFDIYTRWVMALGPLLPMPTDPELYRLREDALGIRGIAEPSTVVFNQPLFAFLLDIARPFLERVVEQAISYNALDTTADELANASQKAAYGALLICDEESVRKQGYPGFIVAFIDTFRVLFAKEIGFEHVQFPDDDPTFIQAIEDAWLHLLLYTDFLYGFEVVPKIAPEDMLRYFKLPFINQEYRKVAKSSIYRQMLNYVVALATFKPVPDIRIKAYFRQELCALFLPLAENIAKREARKKTCTLSEEELKTLINDEVAEAAREFDYFYATKKNVTKQDSSSRPMIFPLNESSLAKLGHIFANDEFPFTSYLERRLETKIRLYFGGDLQSGTVSLDEELGEDGDTRLDTIGVASTEHDTAHIPDYDALDKSGNKIGWKRDTFAGIIGKSKDTLKRWDKEGLLSPQRYPIYSRRQKKEVLYRAYTREDISKAKEVAELKQKRARHQK